MKSRANTDDANNGKLCGAKELPLQDAGTDKLISYLARQIILNLPGFSFGVLA